MSDQGKRRALEIDWGAHDSGVIGYLIIFLVTWFVWTNYDSDPIPELIQEYDKQNAECRGGRPDQIPTWTACDRRSEIVVELQEHGYCKGKPGQAEYEGTWQKCE